MTLARAPPLALALAAPLTLPRTLTRRVYQTSMWAYSPEVALAYWDTEVRGYLTVTQTLIPTLTLARALTLTLTLTLTLNLTLTLIPTLIPTLTLTNPNPRRGTGRGAAPESRRPVPLRDYHG